MPTIRDIAKLAGVSHGTASNVLNGRGNVSMQKILMVEDAANRLGYSINTHGQQLRQEFDRSIAVVLPTLRLQHYALIYSSLSTYMQERGFECSLELTGDVPAQEEIALFKIAGRRPQGVVLVSCQPSGSAARTMLERGGTQIVFLERETDNMQAFVGFDETRLAQCAVDLLPKQNIRRVTLLTGLLTHRSESIFAEQVRILLQARNIQVRTLQADAMNTLITAFASVDEELPPDIIITTALHYAQVVLDAFAFCWHDGKPNIISLSPMGLIPSGDSICHIELNWKYVANRACNMLLKEEPFECVRLPPEKHVFPTYHATALPRLTELNVLMLDEPATHALEKLLPDFTKATGIQVRFAIFPYSELFDVINHMGSSGIYDVIRMDTIWLPSSISKCLAEYDPCGNDTKSILEPMLDTVRTCFTPFDNRHCAFPFTPSVQLQFYRRDLFENVKIRRQFYESNHSNLLVPTNYDAYDTILRFFSKETNPSSPVEYGASVVSGTISGIVCEFLPCFAAMGGKLFDASGNPCIESEAGQMAMKHYLTLCKYACAVPAESWWKGAVDNFTHGNTAILNVFINHASNIANLRKSKIAGRIGFGSIPGRRPLLGGGVLGISAASSKQGAALEFIRWACSEHISVPFTLLGGISPCTSIYQNEELLELYPWLAAVPNNYKLAVKRHAPPPLDEYDVENAIGRAIKNMLFGISTPEETLHYAQKSLEKLVELQ